MVISPEPGFNGGCISLGVVMDLSRALGPGAPGVMLATVAVDIEAAGSKRSKDSLLLRLDVEERSMLCPDSGPGIDDG